MLYHLIGKPTPLARPRFSKGIVYDSQKSEKLRDFLNIKVQHGTLPLFMDQIALDVTFFFEPSKSHNKTQRAALMGKPCNNNIDLDNLIKYIADVCIGVLYTDDKIITKIHAQKIYGPISNTQFSITNI